MLTWIIPSLLETEFSFFILSYDIQLSRIFNYFMEVISFLSPSLYLSRCVITFRYSFPCLRILPIYVCVLAR